MRRWPELVDEMWDNEKTNSHYVASEHDVVARDENLECTNCRIGFGRGAEMSERALSPWVAIKDDDLCRLDGGTAKCAIRLSFSLAINGSVLEARRAPLIED